MLMQATFEEVVYGPWAINAVYSSGRVTRYVIVESTFTKIL